MLKKILIFILLFSLNYYFTYSYLKEDYKNSVNNLTKVFYMNIEKKYTKTEQKQILFKLNNRINELKAQSNNSTIKKEALDYLQGSIVKKINLVTKEITVPKPIVQNPIVTKPVVAKTVVNKPVAAKPVVNKPVAAKPVVQNNKCTTYNVHSDISASVFWVGEGADASNAYISNAMSAWDGKWEQHFKEGTENTFYVALPYNDFDENGNRRSNAKNIPWYNSQIKSNESVVKNKWIKVEYNGKIAYGQWADVGPLLENDFNYVFGTSKQNNTFGLKAGIDLSPDFAEYLGFSGSGNVKWNFVSDDCVPDGKWTKVITKNGISW